MNGKTLQSSPDKRRRHRRASSAATDGLGVRLKSERVRYGIFFGFVLLVFLTGGASRGDVWSLALLRPLAILTMAYALIAEPRSANSLLRFPAALVIGLGGVMLLQLVPLPQPWWSALPGREMFVRFGTDAGLGEVWRPLTMSPSRTQNSLFALGVPLATFLLVAALPAAPRARLIWPLLAAGMLSAVLGLLQIMGPADGPLYTYRITNQGLAVGLFANRNHNAIFLASLIPLIAYAAMRARAAGSASSLIVAGAIGSVLFVVPMILVSGSRAGAILLMFALLATASLWVLRARAVARATGAKSSALAHWALPAMGLAALAVSVASYNLSRSRALERLFESSLDSEVRLQVLPAIVAMARDYFPFGTGFGTFDLAYKIAEPAGALTTSYLNHAHNDALQFVLEGGLPGVLILIVAAVWLSKTGFGALREAVSFTPGGSAGAPPIEAFALVSLAIILAGGIFDYPLRTPALMCAASVLAAILVKPAARQQV